MGRSGQWLTSVRNVISGNPVANVYLFGGAAGNSVRGNTLGRAAHPYRRGTIDGDYGVLRFNSAANVGDVVRRGPGANRITAGRIARFRKFTGPVTRPLLEIPPALGQAAPQVASAPAC